MIVLILLKDLYRTLKSHCHYILLTLLFCLSNHSFAQTKAFPIAEGFGKHASGGRGGVVIKVTNLNDSGPGSLRSAIDASGPRTVVFEVGGTINLTEAINISNPDITIAGQTAPGDGILIKGSVVVIQTSNVIIRYLRFRPGNSLPTTSDGLSITAWQNRVVENVIIDHCSISWADDENLDIRSVGNGLVQNITVQNCIISESGYGILAGQRTYKKTFYKNLFAHNKERNIASNYPTNGTFDFEMINNLIYGFRWATSPSMGSKFTILNNHYRKSSQVAIFGAAADGTFAGQGTASETYAYISGNITPNEMSDYNSNLNPYIENTPYLSSGITAINASQVANDILPHVGASLPIRDIVDTRLINQYNNNDGVLATSGTYPVMQNGTAPTDSDNDGMPNVWENQNGLDPNKASDRNIVQPDGYTNLEYYLNNMSIVANTGGNDCSGEITSFPYTEGFENTLGAWTQSYADDIDWTVDANGTPSSGTGPSSASQGSYYIFVEASGNPTKQSVLQSPCFNLSNLSNANFSFKYHQSGSTDMGTINLEASDDNGASWTSIWNSSGNQGDTWLTADIDLAAYLGGSVQLRFNRIIGGTYQADIAIDDVSLSGVVSTAVNDCSGEITSFPYTEGFENTLGAWTQSNADDIDWIVDANGTPSSGTGPSSASQGSYYIFVEASGNPTKQSVLNSPCFNLSNLSNANFSFKYHQSGSTDMGTINLEASDDNGASWTSIWNSSGNLGDVWLTADIDLAAYIGGSVQLRFNRIIGGTYQADIAIDDVSLIEVANTVVNDCSGEITSFPYSEGFENTLGDWTQSSADDMDWTVDANGTPSSGTGPSSASQGSYYVFVEASANPTKQALLYSPCFNLTNLSNANFSFKYHQSGSNDMGTINLEASDDNGASWRSIWNSSGNQGDTWLTADIDLVAYLDGSVQLRFNRIIGGTYQADLAIDDVSLIEVVNTVANDCSGEITSFPYTEGFENSLGDWTQSSADDMDWTVNANGTPSSGTGPSSASQGSYYVFVEASANPTKKAVLYSPCFNLSNLSNANFSFKYHQYGSKDMGTINLEASDDNGANWTSIWKSSGNLGNIWLTADIDLAAYLGGSVQLRFNRIIGDTYQADFAIDDVSLIEVINTVSNNCSGEITSFPYSEGFENTLGAWTQSSEDDMDWTVDANGTPSSDTGPSSASQGSYYIFVEASANPTKQALLYSPCFNLSNLSNANFSFNYHQSGSTDMGTINLEASDDNGASWTSIWNSSGNKGDTWLTADINLSAYLGGNVQLRFNRVIGGTWKADIAIDNINLSSTNMSSREAKAETTSSTTKTTKTTRTIGLTEDIEATEEAIILEDIKDITLYPNPVKGSILNIKSDYRDISFEIYDMVGKLVSKGNVKNRVIDISNLNAAFYQIRFSSEGKTITKRFIKQ